MSMTTNQEVVRAWAEGQGARSATLSTDGDSLWSTSIPWHQQDVHRPYALTIGTTYTHSTIRRDIKLVLDYTAKGEAFRSVTTSRHVSIAKSHADYILRPGIDIYREEWHDCPMPELVAMMEGTTL